MKRTAHYLPARLVDNPTRRPTAPEQPQQPDDRLLNAREVAVLLGVDISWVKNHCTRAAPYLPYVQLGEGRYATRRFRREQILDFIESRTRIPRIAA